MEGKRGKRRANYESLIHFQSLGKLKRIALSRISKTVFGHPKDWMELAALSVPHRTLLKFLTFQTGDRRDILWTPSLMVSPGSLLMVANGSLGGGEGGVARRGRLQAAQPPYVFLGVPPPPTHARQRARVEPKPELVRVLYGT